MNKKVITILTGIVLLLLIMSIFLVPGLRGIFARSISSPCGYQNHAWGYERGTCECTGIEIDTTCRSCMDAGGTSGCIGIVKNKKCYNSYNDTGEIPCRG